MEKVVNPIGEFTAEQATQATWKLDLRGKTIGLLANGKPNSAELLQAVGRLIESKYDVDRVVWANKTLEAEGPGRPAPVEILDRLSSGAVVVLAASGD